MGHTVVAGLHALPLNDSNSSTYIQFKVMGEAIESPFQIKPFTGAKIPLNSSYSPLLKIHNPHSRPMQILRDRIFLQECYYFNSFSR